MCRSLLRAFHATICLRTSSCELAHLCAFPPPQRTWNALISRVQWQTPPSHLQLTNVLHYLAQLDPQQWPFSWNGRQHTYTFPHITGATFLTTQTPKAPLNWRFRIVPRIRGHFQDLILSSGSWWGREPTQQKERWSLITWSYNNRFWDFLLTYSHPSVSCS